MKKIVLLTAVIGFVAVGLTSCKKDQCVECTANSQTTKVCEDDYTAINGVSWSTYRDALAATPGCKKVNK